MTNSINALNLNIDIDQCNVKIRLENKVLTIDFNEVEKQEDDFCLSDYIEVDFNIDK